MWHLQMNYAVAPEGPVLIERDFLVAIFLGAGFVQIVGSTNKHDRNAARNRQGGVAGVGPRRLHYCLIEKYTKCSKRMDNNHQPSRG